MEREKTSPEKPLTTSQKKLKELRETMDIMPYEEAKRITEVLIGENGINAARVYLTTLGCKNLGSKGYTPELRRVFQNIQASDIGNQNPKIMDQGFNHKKAAYGVIGPNALNLLRNMVAKSTEIPSVAPYIQNITPTPEIRNSDRDGVKLISDQSAEYRPNKEDAAILQIFFPQYDGHAIPVRIFHQEKPEFHRFQTEGMYDKGALWLREDKIANTPQFRSILRNEAWHYLFDQYKFSRVLKQVTRGVKGILLPVGGVKFGLDTSDGNGEINEYGSDVVSVLGESYADFLKRLNSRINITETAKAKGKRHPYTLCACLMNQARIQVEAKYGEKGDPTKKIILAREIMTSYLNGLLSGGNGSIQYTK